MLSGQWSDEVADNRVWHCLSLGQPAHERVPRPLGYRHYAVDLRDHLPLVPANPLENCTIAFDQLFVGPFISL